jgi:aromatic-amino-acid transaminase
MPTWPNHVPVLAAAGLAIAEYPYFDIKMQSIQFDAMVAALSRAPAGDAVLLHGCCHNPTGADLSLAQWETIARIAAERELLPFIDLAYQGLGDGLDADAAGARMVIQAVPEALVSYSCDKNFGLYRDRTGALFGIARNCEIAHNLLGAMGVFARVMWSMPPDHGAAAVRLILESNQLTRIWHAELEAMCARVNGVRGALAKANQSLLFLADQKGLFSNLSITGERITQLREKFGIYMAPSGRINLAGLRTQDVPKLVDALHDVGYFDL